MGARLPVGNPQHAPTECGGEGHQDLQGPLPGNLGLGFVTKKKLKGWLWYYQDQTRRGNAIDPADFTVAAMNRAIRDYDSFKQAKGDKKSDIEVDKIDTGVDWFTWKDTFQGHMERMPGVNGAPLVRCIREPKPAGWTPDQATNPQKRLICKLPLHGDKYETNNISTWDEIK